MKIAYIVLAHKYPEQIARLVNRLAEPDSSFLIHVDKKTNQRVYYQIVEQLNHISNIVFLKRYKCYWGHFNIVAATLEGIRQLIKSKQDFDYLVLLSGQDYQIKSNNQINEFLEKYQGKEFIEFFPLSSHNKWTEEIGSFQALNRIQHWHFRFYSRHFYLPIKRKLNQEFEFYGGSQWWCLSRDCIHYINNFVYTNPDFVNYFKYVFIPDEIFFQTIILNSPFKNNVFNDNLKYIDWEHPNPSYPAILCKNDFDTLAQSKKLFARKFDIARDREILDLIDQKLLGYVGHLNSREAVAFSQTSYSSQISYH